MLIVMNKDAILVEWYRRSDCDDDLIAIGSGGNYALSAGAKRHASQLSAGNGL